MRRHRHALIAATTVALVASAVALAGLVPAAPAPREATASWTSSHQSGTTPSQPRTELLSNQSLQPLAAFASAVEAAQARQAEAAALASREAASSSTQTASGPSSPPSTTTTTAGGCAPSYQAAQEARAEAAGVPCAWVPTAICEEQGYNDANYGFFDIQSWNGYGGYPDAGAAPLSVQLGWEADHGQPPPDGPGQCAGY